MKNKDGLKDILFLCLGLFLYGLTWGVQAISDITGAKLIKDI